MDRKLLLRLGLLLLASVTSARSQQQQGWGSDTVTVQSSEVQIHVRLSCTSKAWHVPFVSLRMLMNPLFAYHN